MTEQHIYSRIVAQTEPRPIHKHAQGRARPLIVVTSFSCHVNQLYDQSHIFRDAEVVTLDSQSSEDLQIISIKTVFYQRLPFISQKLNSTKK